MNAALDTGTLLNEWWDGLDVEQVAEAGRCLRAGTYSRQLLVSLRAVLTPDVRLRYGLDDPHTAVAGDPLGATLHTVLRERLLRQSVPEAHDARWVVPVQRGRH